MDKSIIFSTTIELLSKSKKDISLDSLAKKLGIKKQSLYSYFSSKEDLIKQAIEYASKTISIVEYRVDFSISANRILIDIVRHYVELFSSGIERAFFSYIYTLNEEDEKKSNILNLSDIKYTIESQLFFSLDELKEKGLIKPKFELSTLSHILMLCIIDIIQSTKNSNEREFEINKLDELIGDIL